ncbi:MAG: hypothetical protein ABIG39_01795 [Candidatus Micrarchaeota archaeon]
MRGAVGVTILFMMLAVYATDLVIYEPLATVVSDGDVVDLGTVGPGQTAEIIAEAIIKEGGIQGKGGILDQLTFVSAPDGWEVVPSELYGSPMKAIVKVAKDAEDGEYILSMKAVDEPPGEGLGDVSFKVKVRVSKDVLSVDVWPDRIVTGAGQPAGYYVKISNNGVASDVFEVSSEGMPLWDYKKIVFVPKKSSKIIRYEVAGEEEQTYDITLKVSAPFSSELLRAEKDVVIEINTNVVSDLQATGHGLLLFPIVEQPIYSIMGLISNLIFG